MTARKKRTILIKTLIYVTAALMAVLILAVYIDDKNTAAEMEIDADATDTSQQEQLTHFDIMRARAPAPTDKELIEKYKSMGIAIARLENDTTLIFGGKGTLVVGGEAFDATYAHERISFRARERITKIIIEDSITSVPVIAFNRDLHPVYKAQYSNIMSIEVTAGNNNYTSEDGVLFNKNKTTLVLYPRRKQGEYIIPNSVTKIGERAFYSSDLTSVTIPNSVTIIEKEAFKDCNMLSHVTIPNSVTVIEQGAFRDCKKLSYVIIPNSVTIIEDETFWGCEKLSRVTIPGSVTSIGKGAFAGCRLDSLILPNSVTSIGEGTFSGCINLTSITIPPNVTSIGNKAFGWCPNLTSITIPSSVTSIGRDAFSSCESLTSVTVMNPIPPALEERVFSYLPEGSCLYVPKRSIDKYRVTEGWKDFQCIEPIPIEPNEAAGRWGILSILIAMILSAAVFVIIKRRKKL